MTPEAPARSADQRRTALAAANEIRFTRARLRRQLRTSDRQSAARYAASIVEWPPDWAATMLVRNLVVAVHGIGDRRADRALLACRISPRKRIAGLTDRQRDELVTWLLEFAR